MISHVVLPYITMITENVEQLFMCLLVICVSFLEKCQLSPSAHLAIGCLVFLFILFIVDANTLTMALMVKVWVLPCKHWELMRKFELSSV